MQFLIFYDLNLFRQNVEVCFFSKFGCSNESNSQNGTERMKMLRSEFPSHQSLPHERKIFQTENYRNSHWRCSVKKGVLKNFADFTAKHLCWRLLLIKLQPWGPTPLVKRGSNAGIFLRNLRKFSKHTHPFFYKNNFIRTRASYLTKS